MIKYSLRCKPNDHHFDAWFNNSAAFEKQRAANLLSCPACASSEVEKALMAPNVVTTKGRETTTIASIADSTAPETSPTPSPPAPDTTPSDSNASLAINPAVRNEIVQLARKVRDHIESTTEDVGKDFAQEARKIHYEESEARGIRGSATPGEVEELQEEGIPVSPVPSLPDDHN
ncbi:MAG: DUF1178 family protein [Alphaproteobacteria bacterium]|nr:DUF1178 family protein [Alphaproteobacteria bacterium]